MTMKNINMYLKADLVVLAFFGDDDLLCFQTMEFLTLRFVQIIHVLSVVTMRRKHISPLRS